MPVVCCGCPTLSSLWEVDLTGRFEGDGAPRLYLFDVDDTLEVSGGPVLLEQVAELKQSGHIVGLCGNWGVVTRQVPEWHRLFTIVGPMAASKEELMRQVAENIPASDYILVGNILGVTGASDDEGSAKAAGWRFIREGDFAEGVR